MSSYTEIDTALLDLDFTNPRIQNYLQNYPEESRSGELLAMLLGTGTDSCASLKESIKEHGGIINPIIVNHFPDGRYVVIEGNTRLQIYRDFIRDNVPGNWNKSTHNRRERPVHGHRGRSRGPFYYRITTFGEGPWDARDPHKTTFMTLK